MTSCHCMKSPCWQTGNIIRSRFVDIARPKHTAFHPTSQAKTSQSCHCDSSICCVFQHAARTHTIFMWVSNAATSVSWQPKYKEYIKNKRSWIVRNASTAPKCSETLPRYRQLLAMELRWSILVRSTGFKQHVRTGSHLYSFYCDFTCNNIFKKLKEKVQFRHPPAEMHQKYCFCQPILSPFSLQPTLIIRSTSISMIKLGATISHISGACRQNCKYTWADGCRVWDMT